MQASLMRNLSLAFLAIAIPSMIYALECDQHSNFAINYVLDEDVQSGFTPGCFITVEPDHNGWGSNQDPSLWTQASVTIPEGAVAAQISSYPYYRAEAMYAYIQCNKLFFAIQYWSEQFKVQVLWKFADSKAPKSKTIHECDGNVYTPPLPGSDCVGKNFTVTADTQKLRLPGYAFCFCKMDLDHRGFSANQPPEEWTRIRATIPKGAIAAQLTSYGVNGTKTAGVSSYIMNGTANCNELDVALQYWNLPFLLSVGWLFKGNQTPPGGPELECDAYVYNAPHVK